MRRLEDSPLTSRVVPQEDADELYLVFPDTPRSHLTGCPACGKNNGPGVDGTVELGGEVWRCNCRDQLQRHKHYLNAGVGSTYQFLCWADFVGDPDAKASVEAYVGGIRESVGAGMGLFLWSSENGTGKTFLASLVAKASVVCGYPTYMTTFADMCASLKAGWRDARYDAWYRRKVDGARVLVIDDLGKELMDVGGFGNSFAAQTFDSMLRTRVQQGKVTVVTSNMPPDIFGRNYGKAAKSLVSECMSEVHVGGEDFRPLKEPRVVGKRRVY